LAAQPARPRIQNKNRMEQNFLITDRTLPRVQYTAAWVTEPIASGVPACARHCPSGCPVQAPLGRGTLQNMDWGQAVVAPPYISAYRNPSVLPT
jgi:hypothetical protein